MRPRLLVCLTAFFAMASPAAAAVKIEVLSNRADLISGGDALVAVSAPARVFRNGTDVTNAFERRADGRFEGLVTGLRSGPNTLTAKLPSGSGAELTIIHHPIGGALFTARPIQPRGGGAHAAPVRRAAAAPRAAPPEGT